MVAEIERKPVFPPLHFWCSLEDEAPSTRSDDPNLHIHFITGLPNGPTCVLSFRAQKVPGSLREYQTPLKIAG